MYNSDLWKQSGHWNYYKDDMVCFFDLKSPKVRILIDTPVYR